MENIINLDKGENLYHTITRSEKRYKHTISIEFFGTEQEFKDFEQELIKRATRVFVENKQPTPVINKTFKKDTHLEACQKRAEEKRYLRSGYNTNE